MLRTFQLRAVTVPLVRGSMVSVIQSVTRIIRDHGRKKIEGVHSWTTLLTLSYTNLSLVSRHG